MLSLFSSHLATSQIRDLSSDSYTKLLFVVHSSNVFLNNDLNLCTTQKCTIIECLMVNEEEESQGALYRIPTEWLIGQKGDCLSLPQYLRCSLHRVKAKVS